MTAVDALPGYRHLGLAIGDIVTAVFGLSEHATDRDRLIGIYSVTGRVYEHPGFGHLWVGNQIVVDELGLTAGYIDVRVIQPAVVTS